MATIFQPRHERCAAVFAVVCEFVDKVFDARVDGTEHDS